MKSRIYFLILTISVFSISKLQAQYAQIPKNNNYYWKQWSSCGNFYYQIKYFKDTIVNGKVYSKYYTFWETQNSTPCASTYIKNGFLRHDTVARKTFILDNNFIERPLYNFTKTVGDTMQVYQKALNSNLTVTVVAITTSTNSDGRISVSQQITDGFSDNVFIEGIGSLYGGLYGHYRDLTTTSFEKFVCFGKIVPQNIIQLGDNFYLECFLSFVGVKENDIYAENIKLYPNPIKNTFTLEFINDVGANSKLTITNALGQIVFTTKELQAKQEIDLNFLESGLYFVKVQNREAQKTIKILKE